MLYHINYSLLRFGLILLGLLWMSPLSATSSSYYYKKLSIEDGLSSSRVQALCFDRKGYIWIGTQWGLNCYDQDQITSFFADSNTPNTLPSNNILFVVEDAEDTIWVGTDEGLVYYNRADICFEQARYGDRHLDINSYLLVEDGVLFGGVSEIYKYDYKTKQIRTLPIQMSKAVYHAFIEMVPYDDETIFINTRWYGVYSYNLNTGALSKLDYVIQGKTTILYVDSLQQVWVSYYGKGIVCYKNGEILGHFTTANSDLSYDVVLDMIEKDGNLWLATDGGGINIISIHDFSFHQGLYHTDDQSSFPDNAVYKLYMDPQKNIWAGTIRNGLVGIRKVYAKSYTSVPFHNKYGLSNKTINCFYQDEAKVVWIGTDGGGLNAFYPQTGLFKHIEALKGEKVSAITQFSKNELLLYLFNKGFVVFNKETNQLRPFIVVDQLVNTKMYADGYSVSACYLDSGHILISTNHIYLYDCNAGTFEVIASMGTDYERNAPQIRRVDDNTLFFIDSYAIYTYKIQSKEYKLEYKGNQFITDVCIDTENNYWIGSDKGLFVYNKSTQNLQQIKTDLFQGVKSLITDNQGNLWVGTSSNTLFAYTIDTEQFILFDESEGVRSNEYIGGASIISMANTVLIGGTTGMTVLNVGLSLASKKSSSIRLAEVFINDKPVKEQLNEKSLIRLPWDYSSLKLRILVEEEDLFKKHFFKYYLTSGGDEKEMKSFNHTYALNNLPHGDYQISVSYITPNGGWSKPVKLLSVTVLMPWWKSWWFIGLCFLFLVSVLIFWLKEIEKRKEICKSEEVELLKNEVYEEKIRFLTNLSHELRTPLTLIYSPLKRILSGHIHKDKMDQQLTLIYQQSLQMKEMIDMALNIKKLEDGKEVLSISHTAFNKWVADVVAQFETELQHKNIKLTTHFDNRIETVAFDPNKCFFVLQNLLMNALKFSNSYTEIVVKTLYTDNNRVRVEVKDEGIGLDHADTDLLFSRYYQGNHERGGSGIGLSYAKSLIELHNGEIGALNNSGLGATFYFELPLNIGAVKSQAAILPESFSTQEVDLSYLKNYTLLIVEDADDMRNYIITSLSDYFSKVYFAKDGVEGLILVRQQHPDIVVCDVMMPRMDGFQFCSAVKSDTEIAHIPIIMLTAYTNSANLSTAYKLGADVMLSKPFDLDVLLSLIDNQLKLRKQIKTQYINEDSLIQLEPDLNNADEHFLKNLNDIIAAELGNTNLDVGLLTKRLGVSRSLLYNKVKEFTDMGIIDLINSMRINKAVELLKNSSLNIAEISDRVGFSTPRYFSRVFKKFMGISPTQYRKTISKKETKG